MQNTIQDLLTALITVISGFATKELISFVKSFKNKQLLQAIVKFAEDGVVVAEKAGVFEHVTANEKTQAAINYANGALAKIGYNSVDEKLIKNAVETAYMNAKDQLHDVYKLQQSVAIEQQTQATINETQQKLADIQAKIDAENASHNETQAQLTQELEQAKAQVNAVVELAPKEA